jgi:predicted RecB family nuclease
MRKSQGSILYSPTDLIRFMESPFASWMQRLHLEAPEKTVPDDQSDDAALIAKTGDKHEEKFLQSLQDEGRDIASIPKSDPEKALELTRQAIADGREVIYQGALAMDRFFGFTDFIVRAESGGYEIWDTKLARHTKPYHLIQLCCYAEMLAPLNGGLPENIRVVLGNQKIETYRTADFFHSYLQLKNAFLSQMDAFSVDVEPPVPDPRADHRQWKSHANAWLLGCDHLVQIAGINTSQIRKLEAESIDTVQKLADSNLPRIPKMSEEIFAKVRAQARIQVAARTLPEGSPPPFEILSPPAETPQSGLALLPPPSPGDVYFDIEGYPLENDGLEYLLGVSHLVDGKPEFKDWWAHNDSEERQAFEDFIDWVTARWRAHPDMHIYHYAPYEITAMKRLMGKYGSREAEVDDLLRNGVFIDLYRVVRQGMLIGASSYSLKIVEKLYLPARDGDVQNAAASIVFYADWIESGEPDTWEQSPILRKIRDYNEVDCVSTWKLADWLRGQQAEHGIPYVSGTDPSAKEEPLKEEVSERAMERMDLAARILKRLTPDGDDKVLGEMMAHFIEFHRRDNKPMWWALFERAAMTEDELYDDIGCLAGLKLIGAPVPEKRSLVATYRFDPQQETRINGKANVIMALCLSAKPTVASFDANSGTIELKMGTSAVEAKLGGSFPSELALLPDEFVSPGVIEEALLDLAKSWEAGGGIPSCLRRLLLRQRPELYGLPSDTPLHDLKKTVPAMRGSTLAIQGPPGTGKTYTGSRLIKQLIESGKRVGITSNSHKAIVNLIEGIHKAGGDLSGSVYSSSSTSKDPILRSIPGIQLVDSKSALASYKGGIIAGTAWLFSRPEFACELDYLFVDEAGQVSLANVAAMSQSTSNLILLGDQNQLPMPTQGTHPGESGLSSLVYLLRDHAVVPPDLGVFLETTYRLHPDVCDFISESFYEGQLRSAPAAANHRLLLPAQPGLVPVESGILFHPVPHTGNTQASHEEVAAILEILKSLLGRTFTDSNGDSRPLGLEDILFVAPYNMQVRHLEKALPDGAKVGSVDRFQGQEAPVVIFSLCSSAGEFSNRGLSFILDRNRLNVALSRAQALAIVVGDPGIASTSAGSVKELTLLNTFCRLVSAT